MLKKLSQLEAGQRRDRHVQSPRADRHAAGEVRRLRQAGRRVQGAEEERVQEAEEGEGEERGRRVRVRAAGSERDVRGGGEEGAEEDSRREFQEVVFGGAGRFHREERGGDGQQQFQSWFNFSFIFNSNMSCILNFYLIFAVVFKESSNCE